MHPARRVNSDMWGWRDTNPPWELSKSGGEILELQVRASAEMRTDSQYTASGSVVAFLLFHTTDGIQHGR